MVNPAAILRHWEDVCICCTIFPMTARNSVVTFASKGGVVVVVVVDEDAGPAARAELRAATEVFFLFRELALRFNLFNLMKESLMKLISSLPHHFALSVQSRKLWLASGMAGRCPSLAARRRSRTCAPAFFVKPSAIMLSVVQYLMEIVSAALSFCKRAARMAKYLVRHVPPSSGTFERGFVVHQQDRLGHLQRPFE